MGATAAAFAHSPAAGHFTDAIGLANGIAASAGRVAGVVFAVALLDPAIIGAFAVSLSTAYAVRDTLRLKHSLHPRFRPPKGFHPIYPPLTARPPATSPTPAPPP